MRFAPHLDCECRVRITAGSDERLPVVVKPKIPPAVMVM